jgi:hypothetical protein
MTTISCKIPDELAVRLDEVANERHVAKAVVVRRALERTLQPRAKGVKAFELVKQLCGCLSGPSDLATNPNHLEGFAELRSNHR